MEKNKKYKSSNNHKHKLKFKNKIFQKQIDIMKQINTSYYNNNNIKVLTSKIITTITVKTIKIIKSPREKKLKKINKRLSKNKN